jgi:hypothetical protein
VLVLVAVSLVRAVTAAVHHAEVVASARRVSGG